MRRARVYLAAPLFNERERAFNESLASLLSVHFDVFLPQRDGFLLCDLLAEGVAQNIAENEIFQRDCAALKECDVLVAVLDGAHVDEGVAFEIGFAHAQGRFCLGLQTDVRRAMPSGNNPMISGALAGVFGSADELVAFATSERLFLSRGQSFSYEACQLAGL